MEQFLGIRILFLLSIIGSLHLVPSAVLAASSKSQAGCTEAQTLKNVDWAARYAIDDAELAYKRTKSPIYYAIWKGLENTTYKIGPRVTCDQYPRSIALSEVAKKGTTTPTGETLICMKYCHKFDEPSGHKAKQIVAHEAAHLAGVGSECRADWYADQMLAIAKGKPLNPRTWKCTYDQGVKLASQN